MSASPVTRAMRALRYKALFNFIDASNLIVTDKTHLIDNGTLWRSLQQWRIAEAITQCLMPVYEGTALMAEFDCIPIPEPEECDLMTFQMMMLEQIVASATENKRKGQFKGYFDWAIDESLIAPLLDETMDQLLALDIVDRKRALLNYPLSYERPSDCYLLAWLFARHAHELISARVDMHVNPAFVVKYLRSYFFEDWELVDLILRIFHWQVEDNLAVIEHISERLVPNSIAKKLS
jgi:hypothetical protein